MKDEKNKIVVTNTGSDSITIIDLENNFKTREITLGKSPIGPHSLIEKGEDSLYIANSYDNSICVLNIKSEEVVKRAFVGSFPTHMEIVDENLYVVNSDSNSVTILGVEHLNIIGSIAVGEKPHDIKFDKVTKKIFISNHNGYSMYSLDLEKNLEKELLFDLNPFHLKIVDRLMFILLHPHPQSKNSSIKIMRLENEEIGDLIEIKGIIVDIERIEGENTIYVSNVEDGCLYEIDYINSQIKGKYKIGKMPNNIISHGDNLYITDVEDELVIIFSHSLKKILASIRVGKEPSGIFLI